MIFALLNRKYSISLLVDPWTRSKDHSKARRRSFQSSLAIYSYRLQRRTFPFPWLPELSSTSSTIFTLFTREIRDTNSVCISPERTTLSRFWRNKISWELFPRRGCLLPPTWTAMGVRCTCHIMYLSAHVPCPRSRGRSPTRMNS
jgi:hypothetical protein